MDTKPSPGPSVTIRCECGALVIATDLKEHLRTYACDDCGREVNVGIQITWIGFPKDEEIPF